MLNGGSATTNGHTNGEWSHTLPYFDTTTFFKIYVNLTEIMLQLSS